MATKSAGTESWRGRTVAGLMGLWLCGAGLALAQYERPYDHQDDRRYADQYPSDRGYDSYYHEGSDSVSRARQWGYRDGFVEGQKDRDHGHSFRPTHDDRYEDASDHGERHGMSRQEWKNLYRDAYVRGYERGYGR